jgi:hypothetical protein
VLEVTEQNLDECEPEDAETNAHSQDKEHQIHAEVGIAKDSVQTDVVNNDTAETEPIVEEEPSSIIRDMEMPTFRIRYVSTNHLHLKLIMLNRLSSC